MSENSPVLAVLIPHYGGVESLYKPLRSLSKETIDHDVLIVDDGNRTPLVVPPEWHPRVKVIRHESNQGITAALNTGLDDILHKNYRYVARLDAGDCNVSSRLKKQVAFLERNPECKLVGSSAVCVTKDGRQLYSHVPPCTPDKIHRAMHRQCCFLHPTVMLRTDVFAEVGVYREKYPAAEDYDLFFRIAERFQTANLPEKLVEYEYSASAGISSRRRKTQVLSRLRIVAAHFDPLLSESYRGIFEASVCLLLPRSLATLFHRIQA